MTLGVIVRILRFLGINSMTRQSLDEKDGIATPTKDGGSQ